jgi:hypothetical protein
MFGLFFHGEDVNMVKGHNVGFVVNCHTLKFPISGCE